MKKIISILLCVTLILSFAACSSQKTETVSKADLYPEATVITLSDDNITVDGNAIATDDSSSVYVANDVIYYQDLDTYEDGYPYGAGTDADKHSAEDAAKTQVVHITQAGSYYITGSLSEGQIAVDLGEDAKTDPEAVVTLIFDNADITCNVAPAVIFYNVYECDEAWTAYDNGEAESYEANSTQDTTNAGANVILCDDSVNNIHGSYVAKIYKDKEGEKKLYKFDGAFYSKMSMNINGEEEGTGILNIYAENEGLDSELHLTINGGRINIFADNDGINTNEDGVSVTTINGGELHIVAGLGDEGDGIDSNGYLVINGGTVISSANPRSDSGLDSDMGSFVNGGTVLAFGSTMDWAESDSNQVTMNVQFASQQSADEAIVITDEDGNVVFAYDPDKDEITGSNIRTYQGVIISTDKLEVGKSYCLYVGGDITGTETNGIYDITTVTNFTGTQQCYTGNSVGFGGFGGFGGQRPEMPEGSQPENMTPPEGFNGERPEMPEGFKGERPEGQMPNGMTPPEGFNGERPEMPEEMPEGMMGDAQQSTGETIELFYMEDKVNAFSGVKDAE